MASADKKEERRRIESLGIDYKEYLTFCITNDYNFNRFNKEYRDTLTNEKPKLDKKFGDFVKNTMSKSRQVNLANQDKFVDSNFRNLGDFGGKGKERKQTKAKKVKEDEEFNPDDYDPDFIFVTQHAKIPLENKPYAISYILNVMAIDESFFEAYCEEYKVTFKDMVDEFCKINKTKDIHVEPFAKFVIFKFMLSYKSQYENDKGYKGSLSEYVQEKLNLGKKSFGAASRLMERPITTRVKETQQMKKLGLDITKQIITFNKKTLKPIPMASVDKKEKIRYIKEKIRYIKYIKSTDKKEREKEREGETEREREKGKMFIGSILAKTKTTRFKEIQKMKKLGLDIIKQIITFNKETLKPMKTIVFNRYRMLNEICRYNKSLFKKTECNRYINKIPKVNLLRQQYIILKHVKIIKIASVDNISFFNYELSHYNKGLKMTIERRRWTFYPHHTITLKKNLRHTITKITAWHLTPLDIQIGHVKLTKQQQFWCSQLGYYPEMVKQASEDNYCNKHPNHMQYHNSDCKAHGGKGRLMSKLILIKIGYILYKKDKNSYIFRFVKETFDYLSHRVKDYYFRTYYMIFGSQEEAQYEHKLRFRRCIPIKDVNINELPDEIKEIRANMVAFSEEFASMFCPDIYKFIKNIGISVLQFKQQLSML